MRKSILLLAVFFASILLNFAIALPGRGANLYFTDAMESRGSIYKYLGPSVPVEVVYKRSRGRIYSFLIHWSGSERKVYYVNANENKIYLAWHTATGWKETIVYTHSTYVRDIAWGPGRYVGKHYVPDLYFSEALGSAGNGKIYRLVNGKAKLYYEVKLEDVGGFWAGDFTFANSTLYLSSGNRIPASIYKVVGGKVIKIFTSNKMPIKGIYYVRGSTPSHPGYIYFANFRSEIYRLDLLTKRATLVFSSKKYRWLSDVYVIGRSIP